MHVPSKVQSIAYNYMEIMLLSNAMLNLTSLTACKIITHDVTPIENDRTKLVMFCHSTKHKINDFL